MAATKGIVIHHDANMLAKNGTYCYFQELNKSSFDKNKFC